MRSSTVKSTPLLPFFMPDQLEQKLKDLIASITDEAARHHLTNKLQDKDYNLLLRNAVHHQQIELTTFLLTKVPSVNVNSCGATSGKTALHIVSANGCLPIVKLLVENGAFLNAMDKASLCPVVLAQMNEHFVVMNYLLSQGGMRYLTNHEANVQVSLKGRSPAEIAEIKKAVMKLEECDNKLNARPTLSNKFICAYILKPDLARLNNPLALNKSRSTSAVLDLPSPLFTFFRQQNISLLTRSMILELDKKYKDLPLDAMTHLLAHDLINDESVVLPLPLASYASTQALIESHTSLSDELKDAVKLNVYQNDAAVHVDKALLLRWELTIALNVISADQISKLAKKIGAAISYENEARKLTFSKIDEQLVTDFKGFISELNPELIINRESVFGRMYK